VAAIGSLNLNFGLVSGMCLNRRPGGALRWKADVRQLGSPGSVMWKIGISKVVAPACVG
jgi:hypothetical protein